MSERMSPHFAVFNSHKNDASAKADAELRAQYGDDTFAEFIKPLHKTGIMAIFNKGLTDRETHIRVAWVTLCTYFVNAS